MKEIEIDTTIEAYGLKGGMSIAMKNGYNAALTDFAQSIRNEITDI